MKTKVVFFLILNIFLGVKSYLHLDWDPKNPAWDQSFYEEFLDPEKCQEQLALIRNNTGLAIEFFESGLRIPRGISGGNSYDLGNYFQCIGINENVGSSNIEGKYCLINVPINQELDLPELPSLPDWIPDLPEWMDFDPAKLKIAQTSMRDLQHFRDIDTAVHNAVNYRNVSSRSVEGIANMNLEFTLAVCVPKTCTTKDWINSFVINTTAVGFQYSDNSCRTKNDKPWAPADYVAVVVFSILGCLTLLCTGYDIWKTKILKTDPKQISPLRISFSLYTNARRLTTFTKSPGALECLDGIRAISMMWVIVGHAFSTLPHNYNVIESTIWLLSVDSTWVTAGPISVDTFFMLSGLLLVYTTAGKFTSIKLIKNLHLFYLNRLLRMFPLLAAAVLMQASFFYRLTDGPMYDRPIIETNNCRTYWWTTLLYIQNFSNTWNMCLSHTWYLAVDMQMYILSPLILFWVVGGKRLTAWIALTAGLLCFLVASTVYNFINEFRGSLVAGNRLDEYDNYMAYYYLNTLTRASPFLVGMLFGYLLHLKRQEKMVLSKFTVILLWICTLAFLAVGVFAGHPMKSSDWDNQLVDSLVNSFSRPIWAAGVGLTVVACVHGYGGPLDWFLSLQFWKLPSRLSYGMYLFHFQLMFLTAGSIVAPIYFSPLRTMFRFLAEMTLVIIVSFLLTLFIDSPFSTLFKIFIGGGTKRPRVEENKVNGIIKDNGQEKHLDHNSIGPKKDYIEKL